MAKPKVLEKADLAQLSYSAAKDCIDQLRREIRRHDYLYYVKDRPEVSDEAYDRLFDALRHLEQRFSDLTTPDSPTQRVGGQPQEQFRVVKHPAPLLSLDATREENEVRRFDERVRKSLNGEVRYLLEEKFDGVSVELVYKNGILDRAVTRGDGRQGEDVSENVKTIRSLPMRLYGDGRKTPELLALRGEVSEAQRLVESLGGQAGSSVSGRTDYVVVGREPGKKLEQAKSKGVKTLDEHQFVELVREAGADVSRDKRTDSRLNPRCPTRTPQNQRIDEKRAR